jgi:hypothetical protein
VVLGLLIPTSFGLCWVASEKQVSHQVLGQTLTIPGENETHTIPGDKQTHTIPGDNQTHTIPGDNQTHKISKTGQPTKYECTKYNTNNDHDEIQLDYEDDSVETRESSDHALADEINETGNSFPFKKANYDHSLLCESVETRFDLGNGRRFLNNDHREHVNLVEPVWSLCPVCGVFVLECFNIVEKCRCVNINWQTIHRLNKHSVERETETTLLENKNRFTELMEEEGHSDLERETDNKLLENKNIFTGLRKGSHLTHPTTDTKKQLKRAKGLRTSPMDSFLDDAGYQRLFEEISSQCSLDADMWIQEFETNAEGLCNSLHIPTKQLGGGSGRGRPPLSEEQKQQNKEVKSISKKEINKISYAKNRDQIKKQNNEKEQTLTKEQKEAKIIEKKQNNEISYAKNQDQIKKQNEDKKKLKHEREKQQEKDIRKGTGELTPITVERQQEIRE